MRIQSILRNGILGAMALFGGFYLWAQNNVVRIDSGKIRGSVHNDVLSFKGIPFAAPPIGPLRWRPPQPVISWSGIRSATEYGPDCMQLPFPSDAAPLGGAVSEDCLYLNVWKPAAPANHKLPVMVWIYGGGFVNGGSSPAVYDGRHFAEDGIVFVSFNYRIGRFGFFAFPALTREHPDEPHGDYGYMDQIAALKWVQRNIAAFGGDPKQVTVFGESAGGASVLTLLTSPISRGLFQRAIIESGGGRGLMMGARYLSRPSPTGRQSAEEIGVNFARSVGITDTGRKGLSALRKLPSDKIVAGLNMASMRQAADTYSGPIVDGTIVVESPQSAILSGNWAKVPLIIGANNLDLGFSRARTISALFAPFGKDADKAKAAFDPDGSEDVAVVGSRIAAAEMMIEPARFVARAVSAQGISAYEYRFSYVAQSLRDKVQGARHATEIPYVFYTVDAKYKDKLTPQDRALSKKIHQYWVNFVKTGNPSGSGLPRWPTQNSRSDMLVNFTDSGPVVGPDPWKARLDLIAALANQSQVKTTTRHAKHRAK